MCNALLARGSSLLWIGILTAIFVPSPLEAQRVANTTLTVPEIPARNGYQVVPAFPGLSFEVPVAMHSPPGDSTRLFVVERPGRIQIITNLANPNKTLFLDISSRVNDDSEGGLLGLAFHPDWRNNRRFFVFYTTSTGVPSGYTFYDRISRFEIDPNNPNRALPESERSLISQADEAGNHNAGDVHFGPDGYLYVSLGDEGGGGDSFDNSRYINKDFFSAFLRLDVDKRPGNLEPNNHPAVHRDGQGNAYYSVPADNPFVGATFFNGQTISASSVRTEFWTAGMRNPWRFSFDPATGLLYCADVGQRDREEVNIIEKGKDYGWYYRQGFYQPSWVQIPAGTVLADPILDYPRTAGPTIPGPSGSRLEGYSVTGGIVYHGSRLAGLQGYYIFGDHGSSRVWAFKYNPVTRQAENLQQLTSATAPVAFGRDPTNGDVLIAGYNNSSISLSRLIYSETPVEGQPLPERLSQTGAFSDLNNLTPHAGILPYDLNVAFWSDYGIKTRWFSVPDINDLMTFNAAGNWTFPNGSVWIKHFEMELTNGVPASRRRLETRFLVKNDRGVHGFTYRWNSAQTDADLVVEGGLDEAITVYNSSGSPIRQQQWRYPSRGECLQCHTTSGGLALGFNTPQLNRVHGSENQISRLSSYGYFDGSVPNPDTLSKMVPANDSTASLEVRVRSYLTANCVHCHQPGGTAQGFWDARFSTPMSQAGIIDGALVNNYGNSSNRVVRLGSLDQSMLYQRVNVMGQGHMPPLATSELNNEALNLLRTWIQAGAATRPAPPQNLRIVSP